MRKRLMKNGIRVFGVLLLLLAICIQSTACVSRVAEARQEIFTVATPAASIVTAAPVLQKQPLAPPIAETLPATVTPAATMVAAAQAKPYTIGWISDTQRYNSTYPDTFQVMTKFLSNERTSLNLGYVAMTGDIVNKGSSQSQWRNAKSALKLLSPVPFGLLAGNHDRNSKDVFTNYTAYFGESYFSDKPYYGGSYQNNLAHYDLITLGSTQYIFVYLSYQPDADMIAWANDAFESYPDRVGVLCVHEYLGSRAEMRDEGEMLQKKIVAKNPNVYMVLCGHRYTQACIPARFDDDGNGTKERTVYQCIANYQTLDDGGSGYIRFMEIDESSAQLRFYTYSPLLNAYLNTEDYASTTQEVWPLPWAG